MISDVALIGGGLIDFFGQRLWWWLGPALLTLAVFVLLASYEQSVVLQVTPFIYTLF